MQEGIDSRSYEKCIHANGRVSAWNANTVLVKKERQVKPRLTFKYHVILEVLPSAHIKLVERVHSLLGVPSYTTFFQADMKHGYWAVEVHPEDRHYQAFSIPGTEQLQPTRMLQGTRTPSFVFIGLVDIALGAIYRHLLCCIIAGDHSRPS